MPPEENQGNPSARSVQPGQTPQQLQPTTQPPEFQSQIPRPTPSSGTPKKMIGIIVAAILVLMAALFLLPFSPLSIFASKGAKLMVGDHNRFIHACSVFDMETVAKELGLNADKSKQGIEESFSSEPISKEKSIDLIKLTSESSINSTCKIKYDRAFTTDGSGAKTPSFINVSLFVQQFPTEKEATDKFNSSKEEAGSDAKTLASYKDSSFYTDPTPADDGPTYIQPVVRHKNLLIYFTAPLKSDDQAGTRMIAQLDNVAKDTLRRIDAREGEKPKNLSGITKLGGHSFVDACHGVDYAKFGKVLDSNIEFEPTSFTASQYYAEDDSNGKSPKYLLSVCAFDFRTKTEADQIAQQKSQEPANKDEEKNYKAEYPHFALVQILTTENKESAQKIVEDFKKSGESQQVPGSKIEDVRLGDKAIKASFSPSEDNPYENQLFYVAKDSYTYLISISFKRQSKPFKTTDQTVSDAQAKKLVDTLTNATAKAK